MVSQTELILRVITLWFLVFFFRDGMVPFKDINDLQQHVCHFEIMQKKTIDSKVPEESEAVRELEKFVFFSEEIRNQRQKLGVEKSSGKGTSKTIICRKK